MISKTIKIGTRGSKLALWQANHIADLLQHAGIQSEIVVIHTKGDKILDRSLAKIGSKGVFTEELEQALKSGEIDIAQHSAKDVQSELPDGLELIAYTSRESAGDVVISFNKDFSLTGKGRIGTSSVRRVAFFKKYYPQLDVVDMRGNLQTRVEKLKNGEADALALAFAGVHRMGFGDLIVAHLNPDEFVPPVGQGSIAIEAHASLSQNIRQIIKSTVNDPVTETCLLAERAFLKELKGGCSIPAFCHATSQKEVISVTAGLISPDGKNLIRFTEKTTSENVAEVGKLLAVNVLEAGGAQILNDIRAAQNLTKQ